MAAVSQASRAISLGNHAVRSLRTEIFSTDWPLDEDIRETAAPLPSHSFLANPSGSIFTST